MAGKSPISILQELTAIQRLPAPVYTEEGTSPYFKCTVYVRGITAEAYGANKKTAKTECARNALKKLAVTTPPPQHNNEKEPFVNYVGRLNEFASQHGVSYPDYNLKNVDAQGQFYYECSFQDKTSFGKGFNKKDAKQKAAKHMLEQTKSLIISDKNKVKTNQMNTIDYDLEKIISKYKDIAVDRFKKPTTQEEDFVKFIDFNDKDVESLKAELVSAGVKFKIKQWPNNPSLVYLTIDNTSLCFMGNGKDKEEATKKVLLNVMEFSKYGPLSNAIFN